MDISPLLEAHYLHRGEKLSFAREISRIFQPFYCRRKYNKEASWQNKAVSWRDKETSWQPYCIFNRNKDIHGADK